MLQYESSESGPHMQSGIGSRGKETQFRLYGEQLF